MTTRWMFEDISHVYDFFNHLLSMRLDAWWRYHMVRELRGVGLDVAAGTGESTQRLALRVAVSRVVGLDVARAPLSVAQKTRPGLYVQGDALALPVRGETLDFVTVAFGIRNFPDRVQAFREFFRVLRPGGRLHILEFQAPRIPGWRALYMAYLRYITPRLARLFGGEAVVPAYRYLGDSIAAFPHPRVIQRELREVGFSRVTLTPLTLETVVLYRAWKS